MDEPTEAAREAARKALDDGHGLLHAQTCHCTECQTLTEESVTRAIDDAARREREKWAAKAREEGEAVGPTSGFTGTLFLEFADRMEAGDE